MDGERYGALSFGYPTLAKAEQLAQEGYIVAGEPVVGPIAVRFIANVDTAQELDQLVPAFPCGRSRIHG